MRNPALLVILIGFLALAPRLAGGANLDSAKQQAWSTMDKCNKDAFTKFPDQTKEGEAQRRAFIRSCQIGRTQNSSVPLILHN